MSKEKLKKALVFVAALIPVAIVAGYFTGIYSFSALPSDTKNLVMDQIGGSIQKLYLIAVLQSATYAVVCGFTGYLATEKIGLMKPLKFERHAIFITTIFTLICGLLLGSDIFIFRKFIPQVADIYLEKPSLAYWISSVLYGGVIEEVMMRLFLMSLLSLAAWKIFFRHKENLPTSVLITTNVLTALLFAAGHLPATLQMFGEITPLILLRCFLLNGAAGLFFGRLFRKYGIQYAMLSHAGAHIVWKILWLCLLR